MPPLGRVLAPLSPARLNDLFISTTVGFAAVFSVGRAGEVVVGNLPAGSKDPSQRVIRHYLVERIYDLIAVAIRLANALFTPPPSAVIEFGRVRIAGLCCSWHDPGYLLNRCSGRIPRVIGGSTKDRGTSLHPARLSRAVISVLEQLAGR